MVIPALNERSSNWGNAPFTVTVNEEYFNVSIAIGDHRWPVFNGRTCNSKIFQCQLRRCNGVKKLMQYRTYENNFIYNLSYWSTANKQCDDFFGTISCFAPSNCFEFSFNIFYKILLFFHFIHIFLYRLVREEMLLLSISLYRKNKMSTKIIENRRKAFQCCGVR